MVQTKMGIVTRPSSILLPPAMSLISSSKVFFRSANSVGSSLRMLLSRNSLTHILVELCTCRLALHSGHSRLWSRLRSMHALQYVWPQGVVMGCQRRRKQREQSKSSAFTADGSTSRSFCVCV